jgi:hypothetical protein
MRITAGNQYYPGLQHIFKQRNISRIHKQEVLGRNNHLLSLIWHRQHRKHCIQQFFYYLVMVTFLMSCCLAATGKCTHARTHRLKTQKYAVEWAHVPRHDFLRICLGIQNLIGWIKRHTANRSHKPTFISSK